MTREERLWSVEDALKAGALTVSQALIVFADAMAHEVYCETDGEESCEQIGATCGEEPTQRKAGGDA